MYKQNSEFKSIQKKLVAAVAMVLVACIMVVSSSYAWFTLSTAPEVTGIQTSVGSNGNLEMALNSTGKVDEIGTITGANFPEANNYWGNLVDLSDASYNLDKIALAPARLNISGNAVDENDFLLTPVYGADGRLSNINGGSVTGAYDSNNNAFMKNDNWWGVRAVGVESGLSPAAKALRDARSAVNTAKNNVTRLARASLEVDAINLASIIVAKQLDASKSTITGTEWTQVEKAVENLGAIATELKTAMDKVVSAVAVAQGVDMTGTAIAYSASGATVTKDGTAVSGLTISAELQAGLGKAYTTWSSISSKCENANITIRGASAEDKTKYDTVETIMTQILSVGDIEIDGQGLTGKTQEQIIPIVMNAYLNNEGKLPLNIVNGIYADIEAFVGAYSASAKMNVSLVGTSYEGTFGSSIAVTAQMKVENGAPVITTGTNAYYLDYFVTQLSGLTASGDGSTSASPLDVYGYAIDLAFRTNAANSFLMLQTSEASRVGDDTSAALQGGGSYMEFAIGNTEDGYTLDQMADLMSAIRVVLLNPEDGTIYAVAALDMGTAVRSDVAGTIKAYLYLYEYSAAADAKLTLGDKIVTANTDGTKTNITALTQNQALALTALVYLDGDYVDNSDVAIRGESMTGTLNLQFSSSADLEPMDYTFEEGTPLNAPNVTLASNKLTISSVDGAAKYEVYYGSVKLGEVAHTGSDITYDLSAKIAALTANLTESKTFTFQVYAVPGAADAAHIDSAATEVTYSYTYVAPSEPATQPTEAPDNT